MIKGGYVNIKKERVVTLHLDGDDFLALDGVLQMLAEIEDAIADETNANENLSSFIMQSSYNGDFYSFMSDLADCYTKVENALADFLDERTVIE